MCSGFCAKLCDILREVILNRALSLSKGQVKGLIFLASRCFPSFTHRVSHPRGTL